jgi:uncharacterized protein
MSWLGFPYRIDATGRTLTVDPVQHVADLVELVVMTEPGERVNLPNFGAGVQPLVFGALGGQLVSNTEAMIAGALTQWLDSYIVNQSVTVSAEMASLIIQITYEVRTRGITVTQTITKPIANGL